MLWIDDPRPFWHPLVTVQIYGFTIAYCVNVAQPWDKDSPIIRLACAAAVGALIGVLLVILVKGYSATHVRERAMFFAYNVFARVRQRPAHQPDLLRQVQGDARRGGPAQGRGRAPLAVEAGDRGGAEAHAGAGRAALPVQHAGVGPVPDRNQPEAGERAARPSDRLPARGAATAARIVDDHWPRSRARACVSQHPENAHRATARFRHRHSAPNCSRIRSRRTC